MEEKAKPSSAAAAAAVLNIVLLGSVPSEWPRKERATAAKTTGRARGGDGSHSAFVASLVVTTPLSDVCCMHAV